MRSVNENPIDPLGGLSAPVRPAAPAPAPSPTKGFELGDWTKTLPDGLAEKPEEQADVFDSRNPPAIYFIGDCFMGCIGGPNGPIEVHEDRWFFDGGFEHGYESEEEAEEARDEYLGGAR